MKNIVYVPSQKHRDYFVLWTLQPSKSAFDRTTFEATISKWA
jgi:hypothetical protein